MHHVKLIYIFFIYLEHFPISSGEYLIWKKDHGNFIPLNVSGYSDVAVKKKSRKDLEQRSKLFENHQFQGELIKFAYFQESFLIDFYDHDKKVSGVCGEIWNLLAEYLNFTLLPVRIDDEVFGHTLENGSLTGLLGLMQRREVHVIPRVNFFRAYLHVMDYTIPMWKNNFQLYNRPEYKSNDSWVFKLFSYKTWIVVGVITIIISILGTIAGKISRRLMNQKHYWTFQDYLFYTFAALCSQGWLPKDLEEECKILELSKRIFSWFLLITVSSHLVSYMTNFKMDPPFKNLHSLLNSTNYNVLIYNGSLAYGYVKMEIKRYPKYRDRFIYIESSRKMREKVCWSKKKYAMIGSEDKQQASRYACNLIPTGSPLFGTWTTSGVVKGFKYKRAFDIGLIRLSETGLVDGLKERWLQVRTYNQLQEQIVQKIHLYHVYMIFLFLFVGVILSAIICIFERILYPWNQHYTQQKKLIKFQRHLKSRSFLVTHKKFRPM
ncbi:probable glutamate receptor, partial [Chelonus insularis]|uniref:probable glutamate receptor n=1 Tax=Chelonus insularis TaxID=460826 RepID=UPI00158C6852